MELVELKTARGEGKEEKQKKKKEIEEKKDVNHGKSLILVRTF